MVKVDPQVQTLAPQTILELRPGDGSKLEQPIIIEGPVLTEMFDDLVSAQLDYQQTSKSDPVWTKKR